MKRKRRKKRSIYNNIMAIIFSIAIFGITIINIVSKDRTFSDMENRSLAQRPRFDIDNLVEGRYTKKYEKYVNDQFIDRTRFINIKASIDNLLGRSDNNGVYRGKDNYLFESFDIPYKEAEEKNVDAINKFADKYEDVNFSFLLAPISTTVLKDKLPDDAPIIDEKKYVKEFSDKLNDRVNFLYLYDTMKAHKDEYIYYRTDHHWTTLGAYYGYEAYMKSVDVEPKTLDNYNKELVTNEFYGTLFSKGLFKVKKPDYINIYTPKDNNDEVIITYVEEQQKTASFYSSDYLKKRDKYGMFLSGNHPLVEIETSSEEDKTLLIIKDSYANCLVPFLTSHYKKIILVDPRYYYEDIDELMKNDGVTDVLYLYNSETFFQDNSLSGVLNNE